MIPALRAVSGAARCVHVGRVILFAAIFVLIHGQHQRMKRGVTAATDAAATVPLYVAQRVFPDAYRVSPTTDDRGRTTVFSMNDRVLGTVLQTTPHCDHIIGFSGATNLVLGFDVDERIRKVEILDSQDTRDHVERIRRTPSFLASWHGATWRQASLGEVDVDAVSGATLTSLAIQAAIIERTGGEAGSLRFPDPPVMQIRRRLFPTAAAVRPQTGLASIWEVLNREGIVVGKLFCTSPTSDNIVGYQGPSETWIGADSKGHVIVGVLVGRSFDNEPYVSYVRDDSYFLSLFQGMTVDDLAHATIPGLEIEGVSGATMSSIAIAQGILKTAAAAQQDEHKQSRRNATASRVPSVHTWGTIGMVVVGSIIGLTRLRGNRIVRVAFQIVLVTYLGLLNGDMLSQALVVGWTQHGVPWRLAGSLVVLTIAAFSLPILTGHNVYCHHLCPHGVVQQWLRNRLPGGYRWKTGRATWLRLLPAALLTVSLLVGMGALRVSLVDIEPFDAWVFYVAGPATITIALVGLVVSCFVPMAYCRFGCPTGAMLNYLRLNRRSDRWTSRDWFAVACLGVALLLYAR